MHLPFIDLNFGFSNAENYRRRENKELLQKYFVKDDYLEKLMNPNVYFLVGEKGTGKTAYATFLCNSRYKNTYASICDVRQTEYQKFIEMKKLGHTPLSQYSEVWRTIILLMLALKVIEESSTPEFLRRFTSLRAVKLAVDEFYQQAFSPELINLLTFVESSEVAAELMAKYMKVGAGASTKGKSEVTTTAASFQVNLLKIRKMLEDALSGVHLDSNSLLFIDGIDIRPSDIPYSDYFDCVRGLMEAVWAVNSDYLANIKDSRGRLRVVLLVRPDIFLRVGLHNANTKLKDNSVYLDWSTTYKDYKSSLLFRVADRLLSSQQTFPSMRVGDCWDYYFPFHAEKIKDQRVDSEAGVNSFLAFLRFCYYRPRDISSMIATLQETLKRRSSSNNYVTADDFNDPSFRDVHANYLLGEIRDQLLFYYSQDEYDVFLQFFTYLKGKSKFSYDEFVDAYNEYIAEMAALNRTVPKFFETSDTFLQFMYEQNVICYKEASEKGSQSSEKFIRWCFRERTLSNMAPKVRIGVEYEVFYGLTKALNVGRRISVNAKNKTVLEGTVVKYNKEKKFGFIRSGPKHLEYYFKLEAYNSPDGTPPRVGDLVSFAAQGKYGKPRAVSIRNLYSKDRRRNRDD